jgi:hypothetical protein
MKGLFKKLCIAGLIFAAGCSSQTEKIKAKIQKNYAPANGYDVCLMDTGNSYYLKVGVSKNLKKGIFKEGYYVSTVDEGKDGSTNGMNKLGNKGDVLDKLKENSCRYDGKYALDKILQKLLMDSDIKWEDITYKTKKQKYAIAKIQKNYAPANGYDVCLMDIGNKYLLKVGRLKDEEKGVFKKDAISYGEDRNKDGRIDGIAGGEKKYGIITDELMSKNKLEGTEALSRIEKALLNDIGIKWKKIPKGKTL